MATHDEKPKVKKADRNGNQFSNGEQPLRQSIDGPREPGAEKKQRTGQDGSLAPTGVTPPIDEVAVPADDNNPVESIIENAPAGQQMFQPMDHFLQHCIHDKLLGFQPMSFVVHKPKSSAGKELGEVGVFGSALVRKVHVFYHGNAVRGFYLCGVDEGDPDMRCSFLKVVSCLEENKRRLEKWLGRSLRWPRHGQEAKVTFDSSTFSSYPSGPSSGAAIFLSLIRLLAGVPYRRFVAITGTVSISGHFGSVGSVPAKLDAAMDAAVMSTIVPTANYRALERQNLLGKYDKVVAAKDIVDILHHCLDARDVQLPDPQVMRKELADDLLSRQVVVVKVPTWTSELHWDLLVLEARATVKHGADRGEVVLEGAAEDNCVVDNVVDWIATHQKQLEVEHGPFYIDFSSLSTQKTVNKDPVHIQLAVVPGQLGSHYIVPVAVSLISIATGRRLKDGVALATSLFPKYAKPRESLVFPIPLPRDDSAQVLAGLEDLEQDWGIKNVIMEANQARETQEACKDGSSEGVKFQPVVNMVEAVEMALQPRGDAKPGGLMMREEA